MLLTPANLAGTTNNSKLIVRNDDDTFRDAVAGDIEDLGFSIGGSTGGPVDGLDGICTIGGQGTAYRANYRGETQGTRASAGEGSWYDNVTKKVFVSSTNAVSVYDINGTLLNIITTVGAGAILKGSNATRLLFTKNGCQRINMDTMVVTNGIGGTLLDISPDGTIGISLTNNQFTTAGIGSFTITTFNTITMSVINTYTYTNLTFPSNNEFSSATLISNTEFVVYYADGFNGSKVWAFRSILISTNATINITSYVGANDDGYSIQYSPSDNKIYSARYTTTGGNPLPILYSMDINLTGYTGILSGRSTSPILYRTSDNSIGCGELALGAFNTYFQKVIKRGTFSKKRDTFSLPVSNVVSQIAIIY